MAENDTEVKFEPKPLKFGAAWQVVATYPSGEQRHIAGFRNQTEAEEWVAGEGRRAWLRAKGYSE